MSARTPWPLRCALSLLITQLVFACGGGGGGVDGGVDGGGNPPADTAAPSTRATPVGGSFTRAVAVTLACDDGAGSGCSATYYTLDGSTPGTGSTLYREPFTLSAPATLRFFSVDTAGNAEAPKTETYVIDTTVPTVSANPGGGTFFSPRTVTLSCGDTGTGCAGIHYTTDGSVPGIGSTRYTAALGLSATTTLRFIGVDGAGNTSTVVTETYTFATDTTAPVTTMAPPPGIYTSPHDVTLTCTDDGGSGCDGTFYTLDGSEPTPLGTRYTGAFTVSASTTVRFFSVDAAGNAEPARTGVYTLDSEAPVTAVAPEGGTYPEPTVTVTLTCSDSDTGCGATRYTTDGSMPGGASPLYTGPLTLNRSTTVRFFSVDLAGNVEPVQTQRYELPNSNGEASAQLAAVRAAADGPVNLPVDGAYITFVKPGAGNLANDPAGFFLQAERGGPAIFVEVEPVRLSPEPQAGMRVSLVVSHKRVTNGMVRATLSSFSARSTGHALTGFVQDVSQVDLPAVLPDYEAELISLTGTINGPFALAGAGHEQAPLVTARVTAGSPSAFNFRLRVVDTVRDQLDLAQGCTVGIVSPLWLFWTGTGTPLTQPSVWAPQQVVSLTCPGPRVRGGQAAGSEAVIIRFDRRIDPESVMADGSQFSIAGLTVTGASILLPGREVWLSTSPQTPRQNYTVTVASTVRDTLGKGVDPAGSTGGFRGWQPPAVLRITELAPAVANQRDLVELLVLQDGSTEGMTLVDAASATPLATLPDVQVLAGELIVIHLNPDRGTAGVDAPGSELTSKTAYPQGQYSSNFDTAWDFQGGTFGISGGHRVHRIRDNLGNTQDAIAAVIPGFTPAAAYPGQLQALQAEGQWLPRDCNGVPCTYESFPSAFDVSFDWGFAFPVGGTKTTTVGRVSSWDSNTAGDWDIGPATLGFVSGAARE